MKGFATIIIFLVVLSAIVTLVIGLGVLALNDIRIARALRFSEDSFMGAESGLEDAMIRTLNGMNVPSSYTIDLNETEITVNGEGIGTGEAVFTATGDTENRIRKSRVKLGLNSAEGNFQFAIQVGDGGLLMKNNSEVHGTVFSNGNIEGNNSPRIFDGGAWAAEDSFIDGLRIDGDAHARDITDGEVGGSAFASSAADNITVGGNVKADIIRNSTIGGNAYYQTELTNTTVAGNTFPDSVPPDDVERSEFAISDQQLNDWETEAEAGGVINCEDDEYEPSNGEELGPVKIGCDLEIGGQDEVIVTGTIWVVGDIELKNQAVLKLHSDFDSASGVVIADDPDDRSNKGAVKIDNQAEVRGSGDDESWLMLVSRNNDASFGGDKKAVELGNSSDSGIFFAPDGLVEISNNAALKEVSAWRVELQNSAQLFYESGLASIDFVSDVSAGQEVLEYKEIQ